MNEPQLTPNYVADIAAEGFAVLENFLDSDTVAAFVHALDKAKIDQAGSHRAGKAFGIRNLLNIVPLTRDLANSYACRSLVEAVLGTTARVVRGIYFDKHRDANWKVAWHQDLTIAVHERLDLPGYGPWSNKAGIVHVQPPVPVLENMLTVRIHLDHTDESNGALRVVAGSHQYGRLDEHQIEHWKKHGRIVTCAVERGGVLVMRPLLLHSSTASVNPTHRRVLHFEYSSSDLPANLQWFETSHKSAPKT